MRRRRRAQNIQQDIENRVQEEKSEELLPEETRSAAIKKVSRIAKRLFTRKAELDEEQMEYLAEEMNDVGSQLIDDENSDIVEIAEQMMDMQACDLYEDTNKTASKIASFAKKLIIANESDDSNCDSEECAQEQVKISCAEKLVKIAKTLKAKKQELTASQKKQLKASLVKIAKDLAAAEDGYEVDKSDIMKDYQKSNRYIDKKLSTCVDWEELNNKSTSRQIKPNTQLKDITLDDLRKIMVTLRGL